MMVWLRMQAGEVVCERCSPWLGVGREENEECESFQTDFRLDRFVSTDFRFSIFLMFGSILIFCVCDRFPFFHRFPISQPRISSYSEQDRTNRAINSSTSCHHGTEVVQYHGRASFRSRQLRQWAALRHRRRKMST